MLSSGFTRYGGSLKDDQLTMIAFSTVSGGGVSALTGGNFWEGAATAFYVSLLNHGTHKIEGDGKAQEKPKNSSLGGLLLTGELAGAGMLGSSLGYGAATLSLFGSFTPLAGNHLTSMPFTISKAWSGFNALDVITVRKSLQFRNNRGVPGSYTITFTNGQKYHGQGDPYRMTISSIDKIARFHVMVKSFDWTPSISRREGYKAEYRRMQTDAVPILYLEGWRNPINYNQRNSPGRNYILQDGF